jgi:chemotaxis methyl-accepting protein methylase
VARAGHFPETVSGDIFSGGLDRYFHFAAGHYQIRPSIREQIIFAVHNVLMDPPFTRLDFLTCRAVFAIWPLTCIRQTSNCSGRPRHSAPIAPAVARG